MITDVRNYYKPFEYQTAFDFYKDQHRAHWLADEVPLASDLNDWKLKLTESEKNLIGNILKSFAQTETHVEDYWSSKVAKWFPKPEIQSKSASQSNVSYFFFQNQLLMALSILLILNTKIHVRNNHTFVRDFMIVLC